MIDNNTHLQFLFNIGEKKPNSIDNSSTICPFCNTKNLTDILDREDSIILLKNKYPTLDNTLQTVIIETDDCDGNMSTYSKQYMRKLIQFGVKHWLNMENNGEFKSVVFFKNHGPYSGGTIKHPHMQIVGLKNIDYKESLKDEFFEGTVIHESDGALINLSSKPRVGFTEFNIIITDMKHVDTMADYVQIAVHFILNNFSASCGSFNLFFYHWKDNFICKAIPRYVTSPLFVGYSIPQVSNRMDKVIEKMQQLYFNGEKPLGN